MAFGGTSKVYFPLTSVTVPIEVPFMITFAPMTGSPLLSVTVPVMVRLCWPIRDVRPYRSFSTGGCTGCRIVGDISIFESFFKIGYHFPGCVLDSNVTFYVYFTTFENDQIIGLIFNLSDQLAD